MEHDYGRIRTEYEYSGTKNEFEKTYICETCPHSEKEIDGMKRHLARSHRQMKKVTDLNCPYCEDIFAHLGTLNRHIYINQTCKKFNYEQKNINWKHTWNKMCEKNS